jgi:hypothetical protein
MHVNSESVSNEIDESDLQDEKHDEQRIWTERGMTRCDSWPKYRINFVLDESKMIFDFPMICELSDAIAIEIFAMFANADPSIK